MTKVYYDPVSKGFYQSDINKDIPKTSIEITDELRWELIEGMSLGKELFIDAGNIRLSDKTLTGEYFKSAERHWRDAELRRADIELNKVQDNNSKARGTVTEWRQYRNLLRDWPESAHFPDQLKRPVSPYPHL